MGMDYEKERQVAIEGVLMAAKLCQTVQANFYSGNTALKEDVLVLN